MLDIGSWEFLLIILLGIVVIGPKELPGVIRTVGQWVRRAKDLAREFQGGLEEIARESEIDKLKDNLESEFADTNKIGQELLERVDPDGDIIREFDFEDGEFYSDHEDLDDDAEVAGPPVAKISSDATTPVQSKTKAENDTAAPIETDTKTDR